MQTLSAMKHALYLLALVTSQCIACESVSIEAMRKDVEASFAAKSFGEISAKYGESQSVELKLENEYEDEEPVSITKFSSVGELSRWFGEKHQYIEHMLVPEQVVCRDLGDGFSCEYELPALTLHHGVYLLGFTARREGQCTLLAQVYIYWG
jgi:hypothetical protein